MMSFRLALFAYTLLFLLLTSAYWVKSEVISPHRQFLELAAIDNTDAPQIENRKFTDFSHFYIPEISEHLTASRSGWLPLWTNKNELGRPLDHLGGFSLTYFPSWILSQFTKDPWVFITILSLFTCFLSGIFIIFFCREINLSPLAGLIAGSSMAASPQFMYWLSFPMFPAAWCWAAGMLWGVTRISKKPDLLGWTLLAFGAYSLLLTAYPQSIVYHAYILSGYGILLLYRKCQISPLASLRYFGISLSALITGLVFASPVYIDLWQVFSESARTDPDPSFLTVFLPSFNSLSDAIQFLVLSTMPELLGHPIQDSYPLPYEGVSITPLFVFFAVAAFFISYRERWGWWLAIMVIFLVSLIPPLYLFFVKYLGFNLSPGTPLGSAILPLTVIVAYGVDALLDCEDTKRRSYLVIAATMAVMIVLAIAIGFALSKSLAIRWDMVLVTLVLATLLAAQYVKTHPTLLIIALATAMATISYPLMFRQKPKDIAMTSPLVEKIRANLPQDSRFVVVSPHLGVLPPNLNSTLGLASIHSYNSLSSRYYHTLIRELGGNIRTYGQWNSSISPDYTSSVSWMSNVGMVLAPARIMNDELIFVGNEAGVHLHKVASHMGYALQVYSNKDSVSGEKVHIADPRSMQSFTPSTILNLGDFLKFSVQAGPPSLLILSQKFHGNWKAEVLDPLGWKSAGSAVINDGFQGVILPENVTQVRLTYKSYVRYTWIGHVFWSIVFLLLFVVSWKKRELHGYFR